MSRLDETTAFAPEPSWTYSALQKPIPENTDVLQRTVVRIPPTGSVGGSVLNPINQSGQTTIFNVSTAGNSKILLHQTAIEVDLVFSDGASPAGTMVEAVPIFDIWAALINTLSFSLNVQATPIFTSVQGMFLEQHLAYLFTHYSNTQLEQLPWLCTPVMSTQVAIHEGTAANGKTNLGAYPTYEERAVRLFYGTKAEEEGAILILNDTHLKTIRLVIPLRDALGIRLPDSAPNNLRSMQLSIQWADDRTRKPFVRFNSEAADAACAVSVVGINMLVASSVMSGSETMSSVVNKQAEKMDILGFLVPQPMRLQPALDMIFGSVSNLQMVYIMQSAFEKSNGLEEGDYDYYSDACQMVPFNAYRAEDGALVDRFDIYPLSGLPQGSSITYGSIGLFPSQPLILNDGGNRLTVDQAKYYYDLAIDRCSRRDLVPAVSRYDFGRTFFVCLKPFGSENLTLTRVAKDLIVRHTTLSTAPNPAGPGDDGRITVVVLKAAVYGLTVDGQVLPLQ